MSFTLIVGTPGDDNLIGNPVSDLMQGGDGNDFLSGYGGNDVIEGGDGDDNLAGDDRIGGLSGDPGDDTIDGGAGNDYLTGEWDSDSLLGGLGDDILEARHEPGGDAGRDTLLGGDGNDRILLQAVHSTTPGWNPLVEATADGGAGIDSVHILFPGVLDDLLIDLRELWHGGTGIVRQRGITSSLVNFEAIIAIEGGYGADTILVGDMAGTFIRGQQGDDLIVGGRDTAAGTGWDDNLNGGVGSDTLLAYEGNDTLTETGETIAGSSDLLRGGLGDDLFQFGTSGAASASTAVGRGQEGDDSFLVRNFVGYLDGGVGTDSLDLDLRRMDGGVMLDLRSSAITGGGTYVAGGIAGVIRGFEEFRLRTSDGNDKVLLGDIGMAVQTRRGADTVIGGGGADTLDGGGADLAQTLLGRGGDDVVQGGAAADILAGNEGLDTIFGYEGADTLRGGDDADELHGEMGADRLDGGAGADTLLGGDGADLVSGGGGDDLVIVDAEVGGYYEGEPPLDGGVDTVTGGEGADTIILRGQAARVDGGAGADLLVMEAMGGAVRADLRMASGALQVGGVKGRVEGIETIQATLSDARDRMILGAQAATIAGQEGADTLVAGSGAVEFSGGGGADSLVGGIGDDVLSGEDGDDILMGGDGNDSLVGGAGADRLTSGAGNDTLVGGDRDTLDGGDGFNRYFIDHAWDPQAMSVATVFFDAAGTYGDGLDLSLIDANPFTPEDDAFIAVDALTGQAGQADILDSGLAWDLDLDGDGAADLTLQFSSEALFLVIL